MKHRFSLACFTAAGLLAGELVLGLVAGCSSTPDTGGERVTLETRVEIAPAARQPFTTSLGWQITLGEAYVSIGELRYFEGEPVTAFHFLQIATAHAHPGHYEAGGLLGEMLTPASVDLLQTPLALASGDGVTGQARSARFGFHSPAVGSAAAPLGDAVARVAGSAVRDQSEIAFVVSATIEDVADTSGAPFVQGCVFADGNIDGDGTVVLTIDPALWLDQIDFSLVSPNADGTPVEIAPGGVPHNGFVRGLKKAAGYGFVFEGEE